MAEKRFGDVAGFRAAAAGDQFGAHVRGTAIGIDVGCGCSLGQVASAIQQQIGNLTYYFMPTAQLPLLDPLRMLPILGNPLADLLQPFLRPIVDLGYAPGLLPGLNPLSVAGYVGQGATAGIASPLVAGLPPLVSNSVASGF